MRPLLLLALGVFVVILANKDYGIPNWTCDAEVMKKSKTKPTSVHSLRFADIDLIGALGDSLTAANGAGAPANDPVAVMIQYRGLAFSVGGDMDMDSHLTLANIMKKFNPNLFGFSTGTGSANVWQVSRLNAAVPGAVSGDLVGQANDLVRRLRDHPEINVKTDWKLIHIFIGGNDICAWCTHQDTESATRFRDNIGDAIQILKDNLPRTVVVLVGMLDISLLRQIDKGKYFCDALHAFECSCEQNSNFSDEQLTETCHEYMPDGEPDLSFFAPDCFHFSQYGHAVVAKNLWNNINQPVGFKSRVANLTDLSFPLMCPDQSCPFIRTSKNSDDCSKYMTPSA